MVSKTSITDLLNLSLVRFNDICQAISEVLEEKTESEQRPIGAAALEGLWKSFSKA